MNLDTQKTYATLDVNDIGYGVVHLPDQIRIAWDDTRELDLPTPYRRAKNVVIAGMGGSSLGPDMVVSAFRSRLRVPVVLWRDYGLPAFANKNTLVILSSFSGTTEETLSSADEAKKRGCMIAAITTGGALATFVKKNDIPAYIFTPGDLAKAPRFGGGFLFTGTLAILEYLKLLKVTSAEVIAMRKAMAEVIDNCAVDVKTAENPAKQVAKALVGKSVLTIGAEHLFGNAHVFANHINESGKQFAVPLALPELNHHFLEGLVNPTGNAAKMAAILLRSSLYNDRVQKRCTISANMLEQACVEVIEYEARGKSAVEEVGEVLQFSAYTTYYLGLLNGIDPIVQPFVDEFKKQMSK